MSGLVLGKHGGPPRVLSVIWGRAALQEGFQEYERAGDFFPIAVSRAEPKESPPCHGGNSSCRGPGGFLVWGEALSRGRRGRGLRWDGQHVVASPWGQQNLPPSSPLGKDFSKKVKISAHSRALQGCWGHLGTARIVEATDQYPADTGLPRLSDPTVRSGVSVLPLDKRAGLPVGLVRFI